MLRPFVLVFFLHFLVLEITSQEKVVPINVISSSSVSSPQEQAQSYIYLLDTLRLPFVCDFSRKVFKELPNPPPPSSVKPFLWHSFSVDGEFLPLFSYRKDTTYIFQYDFTSDTFLKYPQAPKNLVFYNKTYPPSVKISLQVWPSYHIYVTGGDTSILFLSPDTTVYNDTTTLYLVKDDTTSLLISYGASLAHGEFQNPVTMGTALFNGLDSANAPYQNTPGTWGVGDIMESKPIDLSFPASDSIYFSFYYGSCGWGDMPDPEDSLILEFFSPVTGQWHRAWSTEGGTCISPMQQVLIPITEAIFLQKGFKFRFSSYASLYGPFDFWFIDYIYIDTLRSYNDTYHEDVAFTGKWEPVFGDYTTVPFLHYIQSPSSFTADTSHLQIRNLSASAKLVTTSFIVEDIDNSTTVFISPQVIHPIVPSSSLYTVGFANDFAFPGSGVPPRHFRIRYILNTTPDLLRANDTLDLLYTLDTYYALDDGYPEKAYTIYGTNGKVAVHFWTPVTDQIQAVIIYFPPGMSSSVRFKAMVWTSLDEAPAGESEVVVPAGGWQRIPLKAPVAVSGNFYAGYEQLDFGPLYVGMDMSFNNQSRTFYNTTGTWQNTSYNGTLLIRPDFGTATLHTELPLSPPGPLIKAWSPHSSTAIIEWHNLAKGSTITIFSPSGAILHSIPITISDGHIVVNLPGGIYFLWHHQLERGVKLVVK